MLISAEDVESGRVVAALETLLSFHLSTLLY